MPCFGFGLSIAGFWYGKLMGRHINLYLTPELPSAAFSESGNQNIEQPTSGHLTCKARNINDRCSKDRSHPESTTETIRHKSTLLQQIPTKTGQPTPPSSQEKKDTDGARTVDREEELIGTKIEKTAAQIEGTGAQIEGTAAQIEGTAAQTKGTAAQGKKTEENNAHEETNQQPTKGKTKETIVIFLSPAMADPEVGHGFVYNANGQVDILKSPFFDFTLDVDQSVEEYVDRIIFQLVATIDEQISFKEYGAQ
ncbi:hypothetical protein M5K25_016897 [Dendrobium thyrsiflorum]|uniref:Uncharacterized protein n=1 Tax=Dendrobium thyrsiflorum TaxID=117978 RepID=A0ABD0UT38_DENTH